MEPLLPTDKNVTSPSKSMMRASHSFSFVQTNCHSKMILGHNFSQAHHIGTLWKGYDVMSLTKNGIPFTETLPTNDINTIVFCAESTVIPPYSNGYVKCKMPKVKEGHTLTEVVCLSHCLDTDPYTLIVTHMKDL